MRRGLPAVAEAIALYLALFFPVGRYARWTGRHWLPLFGSPSPEDAGASIRDKVGPCLSTFFIGPHDETTLVALDVDRPDGRSVCFRVAKTLAAAGTRPYVEASRRGAHLWLPIDGSVPATVAHRTMLWALATSGYDPVDPTLEVRPSREHRTSAFAGGSLRAPWQRHPATGERYGLLDGLTGQPLHPTIAGSLVRIVRADADVLHGLAHRHAPVERVQRPRRPLAPPRPATETVTAVLLRVWGIRAQAGRSLHCPIHDDRAPSAKVAPDDRRLWCWSSACPVNQGGRGVSARMLAQMASI